MFAENHHYGHAELLLRHCGLPRDTRIPMRLQHGWQPGPGLRARDLRQPGRKIVWSSRNLEQAAQAGYEGAVAVGAPWLYLPEQRPPEPEAGLLVMPFHGWERERLSGTMDSYAEALCALEAEGLGPITVCLYWFEHRQAPLRELFESRGFATTTMGHREDNPDFLHRLRALIWRHRAVSSNRVSTAAFYALASGRPFFVYGPPAGLSASEDPSGEVFDAWQRETFPELCWERFDGGCRRAIGEYELGLEHRRDPGELRETLLLGPRHRGARARLRLARGADTVAQLLVSGRKR